MGEGTSVLQLQGTHGSSEAGTVLIVHSPSPAIEIAGTIGVTTTGGIHQLAGRESRCLVIMAIGIDDATASTKGDDDLANTPVVDLLSSSVWH